MKKPKKHIGILATGGTISMEKTSQGYRPALGYLKNALAKIPELHNKDVPTYEVLEPEAPIDSANMTPAYWQRMGEKILEWYDQYDGFVILHGTDTMAYSASALSFILENLNKPVILTGSQLPLFETRNDARENLINAVFIAGNYDIPEVCIYFNNRLFRGNRTIKMDASSFAAFESPNFPALGILGTQIEMRQSLFLTSPLAALTLAKISPIKISIIQIFPGMCLEFLEELFDSPLQALILQTYGVGTAPNDERFLNIISKLVASQKIVINCSQSPYASIRMSEYATSSPLLNAGVISGGDMTAVAALTKLFYLFSKNLPLEAIKQQLMANLRGELTL